MMRARSAIGICYVKQVWEKNVSRVSTWSPLSILKPAIVRLQTKLATEDTSVLHGILHDVAVCRLLIAFVTPFASAALLHHSR